MIINIHYNICHGNNRDNRSRHFAVTIEPMKPAWSKYELNRTNMNNALPMQQINVLFPSLTTEYSAQGGHPAETEECHHYVCHCKHLSFGCFM